MWRLPSTRRVVAARALLAGCGMDLFMHDAAVAALAVADLAGQARDAYLAILQDPTVQHMLASTIMLTHDSCTSEALAAAAAAAAAASIGSLPAMRWPRPWPASVRRWRTCRCRAGPRAVARCNWMKVSSG